MIRVPTSRMYRMMRSGNRNSNPSVLLRTPNNNSRAGRKNFSTMKDTSSKTAAEAEEEARQRVLHDANEKMKSYHHARLAKLRGELPSKRKTSPAEDVNYIQVGVVVMFVICFTISPFLGKKIARDKEFREKYVPEWYDFTIKKPTSEMTREETHQQILQLQKEIRARAINGDFTDEKLAKMRRYMDGLDPNKEFSPDNDQHAWSKLHPGVDDDEEVEDE